MRDPNEAGWPAGTEMTKSHEARVFQQTCPVCRRGPGERCVVPAERLATIALAIMDLQSARNRLRDADAPRAAAYVARALKSAEGAYRHADRLAR